MKNKYLCVHGHFYQPPRENPWLDLVEPEESAHPYPNWNEKIFQECYGPNSACPLLDEDGRIAGMADNYRAMSFNFGPSLLEWILQNHPAVYKAIIDADRASCAELDGHGNALAMPYYHAILPLQSPADKRTLVRWGVQDFRARFGREPEGFWLPETAVDGETLEVLIEQSLKFTVLSPTQAARLRDLDQNDDAWVEASAEKFLPTRPYRWISRRDPSKQLAIFFYHQLLHESVNSGEAFKADAALFHKINGRYLPDDSTQLVSVAVDGEFFGHHHRAGAAVLAETFRLARETGLAVTNYAHFLSRFPPPQEVELTPRTAWSCAHGLGRWSEDCGCRLKKGTSQAWRGPLRGALDWLAAEADKAYSGGAGHWLRDFKTAREAYGRRLADPSPANAAAFLDEHALPGLSPEDRSQALRCLELARERLAMFTSCGWFFDEVSGLETTLCLRRAARAVELARGLGAELGAGLVERLAQAKSNVKRWGDAAKVYAKLAVPARAGRRRAAAHFALLDHIGAGAPARAGGFSARREAGERRERRGLAGRDRSFSWGRWKIEHAGTLAGARVLTAIHQADRLELRCWVGPWPGDEKAGEELAGLFETLDAGALDAELAARFGGYHFGLDALFAEARLNAVRQLLPAPMERRERALFRKAWSLAVARLRAGEGDEVLELLARAKALKIQPDQLPWIHDVRAELPRQLEALRSGAGPEALSRAARWTSAFEEAGLHVDVWELQQLVWRWRRELSRADAPAMAREAALALGEKLGFAAELQ